MTRTCSCVSSIVGSIGHWTLQVVVDDGDDDDDDGDEGDDNGDDDYKGDDHDDDADNEQDRHVADEALWTFCINFIDSTSNCKWYCIVVEQGYGHTVKSNDKAMILG